MSDLIKAAAGPVSVSDAENQYKVGALRLEDGGEYRYLQADAALTANHAVVVADANGRKVTGATAAGQVIAGVAEVAVADESYVFVKRRGVASALVADGVAAGDVLAPSSVAGVLDKYVARGRMIARHDFNGGDVLADGTTYSALITFGAAVTVKRITAACISPPDDGDSTIKVLKGGASGDSMLADADYDPTDLDAEEATELELTDTAADLAIAASGADSCIYVEFDAGTITANPSGVSLTIEVEPTAGVQVPCAVALEANSSGNPAAKKVFLF